MTFDDYLAIPAVNWSSLKHMWKHSPLRYLHARLHGDDDTTSRGMGRALHTLALTPNLWDAGYAIFDGDRRGTKAWDAFEAANPGKTLLKASEIRTVMGQARAVQASGNGIEGGGSPEQVIQWTDAATGIACKGMLDIVGGRGIIDLKGCGSIAEFERRAVRDGYAHQLAFYRRALHGGRPGGDTPCHNLAVEISAPHDVALLTLSPTLLDWADRELSTLLARVAACQDSGIWPGRYPDGGTLELPTWLIDDDLDIPEEGVGDVG